MLRGSIGLEGGSQIRLPCATIAAQQQEVSLIVDVHGHGTIRGDVAVEL